MMSSLVVFLKAKKYYLGIFLILVLASFLRVHNLVTQGLHNSDEVALLMEAWGGQQPLRAKPSHIFMLALSQFLFGPHDYSGLLASAFFGVLTVGLIFVLGRRLYNIKTGILAAAWLAVSGYHIFFSRTVHAEIDSVFFFILGVYFYYLSRKQTRFSYLILALAGLFSGLAYTFQYRLFLIPVFLAIFEIHFLFVEKKMNPPPARRTSVSSVEPLGVSSFVAALLRRRRSGDSWSKLRPIRLAADEIKFNRKIKRFICLGVSLVIPILLWQLVYWRLHPSFTYFDQLRHLLFRTGASSSAGFSLNKPFRYLRFLWLFEGIPIFALTIFALGYHLKKTWPRFKIEDIIVVTPLLGFLLLFSLLPFKAPRVIVIILPFLALTVGRLSEIFTKDFLLLLAICVIITVGIVNSYKITQLNSGFQEAFTYLKNQGANKVIISQNETGMLYLGIQNVKNMPLPMEELRRLYVVEGYRFLLQDHHKYSHYGKSAFEIEEGYPPVMEIENTFYRFPPLLLGGEVIRTNDREPHWNYIKIYDLEKIFFEDKGFDQIIPLNLNEGRSESILQDEKGGVEIITKTVDLSTHSPKEVWISWEQDLSVKEVLKAWHKLNDEIYYSQTKYPVVNNGIFDVRRDGLKMAIKESHTLSYFHPTVTTVLPSKKDEVGIVYHGVKLREYGGNRILVRKDSISHGEKYSIRYKPLFPITAIEIQTRTSPDEQRWLDWSEPYRYSAGEALKSPRGRYLQCRLTLLSKDGEMAPILKSIKVKIRK